MDALAGAIGAAAVALLAKVAYDLWNRWREQRGTAAALAGEIGAYIALLRPKETAIVFRQIATFERSPRQKSFRGMARVPSTHPVFDKISEKIGILSVKDAMDISKFYNVITGLRLHINNFSSETFIDAEDAYQIGILIFIASGLEEHIATAGELVDRLRKTANQGFISFVFNIDAGVA
jgi:hypothetical protein